MTNYTPGPWTYELDVVDEGDINVFATGIPWRDGMPGLPIAGIDVLTAPDMDDGPPREVALANARLIAAAPDLLRAAQEALSGMDGGEDHSMCHTGICSRGECSQCQRVDSLRAAIRKAIED